MWRRSTGTWIPAPVSVRTSSCSTIRPVGRVAERLTVVCRSGAAEEGGHPGYRGGKTACGGVKPARRLRSSTHSISKPAAAVRDAAGFRRGLLDPNAPSAKTWKREAPAPCIPLKRTMASMKTAAGDAADAGDVGGKGDHRAELPKTCGEGGDESGQDSGQHERQRDAQEAVEGRGAERSRGIFQAPIDILQRQADRPYHERKAHHRGGERGAGCREGELDTQMPLQPPAEYTARAEQHEQHVADGHGRQHQGQMHEGVKQRASGEARAREHPGGQHRQGQTEANTARGHVQTQPQGLELRRSEQGIHRRLGARGVSITGATVSRAAPRRPLPESACLGVTRPARFAAPRAMLAAVRERRRRVPSAPARRD